MTAWALFWATAPAGAQSRRSRRPAAALRQVNMAAAHLGGPAAPGQLNLMFDAAKNRPAGIVAPDPKTLEQAGSPNKKLETLYRRPAVDRLHQELVVPVPKETPAYRRTFKVMLADPDTTDRWDELILRYARIYRLDSRLLKSIMAAESEFKPEAVSPSGARGLMQVMPKTSEGVGVSASKLHDPKSGVKAGAAYIQTLFRAAWRIFNLKGVRYTDAPMWVVQRVIAAYHAGPRFLTKLNLYPSTRAYVRKVVLFYHSKVTDLRRPAGTQLELPAYAQAVTPSGLMY
ncbi:MAG: transglycosylase SLT domain-containing protein [Elusimicrobia bacterium]|nr:transglycosylase SLT domain-containing protein [Elusimicrobiota bacterium]